MQRVVAANGCKYIGDLLAREVTVAENISWKPQIFWILRRLAPGSASTARTIGRQLAMSDGGAALLSTFLSDDCDEAFKDMVVEICTHSPPIREYFSDHEILEKVVAMNEPSTPMISILCAYTKEAWSRERLLSVGALDVLLNRCSISTQLNERLMIISSLVHFSHYISGLVHIFRSAVFLKTVLTDISNYLGKPGVKCKHKYNTEEIMPCTTAAMNHRVALRKMCYITGNKDRVNGCFYGRGYSKTSESPYYCSTAPGSVVSWSRSVSPPSNSLSSFSGATLSPSSGAGSLSPQSAISPSSSVEDFFSPLFVGIDVEDGGDCENIDNEEEKKETVEADFEERIVLQKMVSAELQLFSYASSENNILGILFRED
uniref:ARM repeat superfamily protein n=1 Tax=Syphacia muris TaxID=451379 RepID=A0A0N5AZK5_9BILA